MCATSDVYGTVFFKDVNALDSGIVVNYSSDRLVFYHDKIYAKDFTAYVSHFCHIISARWLY